MKQGKGKQLKQLSATAKCRFSSRRQLLKPSMRLKSALKRKSIEDRKRSVRDNLWNSSNLSSNVLRRNVRRRSDLRH